MKVKKYKGNTMPEVMQLVRKELGKDAVILNSKVVHEGGFLGLFKKRKIEVLAAIDRPVVKESPKKRELRTPAIPSQLPSRPESKQDDKILKELRQMKKWMEKTMNSQSHLPLSFQAVYKDLVEKDVDDELANELIGSVYDQDSSREWEESEIKKVIQHRIKKLLTDTGFYGGMTFRHKMIHFVGPTGVGKTTTIAKLAAHCVLKEGKKVAFITTDTYRIAAIDQLKTYAKILNVPIEVAYDLNDYRQAKQKFAEMDHIFVDTAGRNYKENKYIEELNQLIDLSKDATTYLVLSLTAKARDMEEIYERFKDVPIQQFIFTKMDETDSYGAILSLCLKSNLGIAFLTNGQDVPEDLKEATIDDITKLIIGEEND